MISVKSVFDCMSGNTDLTEEFIYNNIDKGKEEFEVLSSSTEGSNRLGFIPISRNSKGKNINVFKNKQGILVARNGKAGKLRYLEKGNYTINDHAYILSLKQSFINKYKLSEEHQVLFLKYYIYRYQYEVYSYSTKNDNATWSKTAFFKYSKIDEFNIEDIYKIVDRYEKCEKYRKKIDEIDNTLEELMGKTISVDTENIKSKVVLNEVLSYISRNDILSEEGIYRFCPKGDKTIDVLSGSIKDIYYGKIDYYTPKIHKLENRQGIHIVTRGKAGRLTFLEKGTYATNTNAFILYIDKDKWSNLNITSEEEEKVFLEYLIIYLQPIFLDVSSNSDVSVFPLTNMMNSFLIPEFRFNEDMVKYTNLYYKSKKIKQVLQNNRKIIDNLFEKQVIME
ncbi:MAG: hypothetical protein KZY55_08065 [Paeniclostridium sp.]|nr:hypothetical protein [Paeniclostridium sp.]MBW4862708.1 hypothetical protein [Paeniclostridium sp.]MBW4874005.1 hypothetical protein [Paeniclostridium sp.]